MSNARRRVVKTAERRTSPRKDGWGNPLCRRCLGRIPYGRRIFCSDSCTHEWRLATSPEYLRSVVVERDNGICVACGFDGVSADYQINLLREQYIRACSNWGSLDWLHAKQQLEELLKVYRNQGFRFNPEQFFRPGSRKMRSLWEADHIIAVAEGGGECDLDNVQTLCLRCHNRKSAELRKKLQNEAHSSV